MEALKKEIMKIEVTDELITKNKRYQKLCDLSDKFDVLIGNVENEFPTRTVTQKINSLFTETEYSTLDNMRNKVQAEITKIYQETQKQIYLTKMVKGAMMLKTLKNK